MRLQQKRDRPPLYRLFRCVGSRICQDYFRVQLLHSSQQCFGSLLCRRSIMIWPSDQDLTKSGLEACRKLVASGTMHCPLTSLTNPSTFGCLRPCTSTACYSACLASRHLSSAHVNQCSPINASFLLDITRDDLSTNKIF